MRKLMTSARDAIGFFRRGHDELRAQWDLVCTRCRRSVSRLKGHLPMVLALCGLEGGSLALMKASNSDIQSIGSNLAAGFIQTAVTIYFLDFMIRRREQAKALPLRIAIYNEICIVTNRFLSLWRSAYCDADCAPQFPGDVPRNWSDLLSGHWAMRIRGSLRLESLARTHPPIRWAERIDIELPRNLERIDLILTKYPGLVEPRVFRYLNEIAESVHREWGARAFLKISSGLS